MIVICSHFVRTGEVIGLTVVDNLELFMKDKQMVVIQHALNKDFKSRYYFSRNQQQTFPIKNVLYFNSIFRYFSEFYASVLLLFKLKEEINLFIGINPLNALVGCFYKFFHKNTKVVYYITDYSPIRFESKLLNSVYHFVERYVTKRSDYLLCVSNSVYEMKKKIRGDKVLLFNNYPPSEIVPQLTRKDRKKIYIMGFLDDYYMIKDIYIAIKDLGEEVGATFSLIGEGPKLKEYQRLATEMELNNIEFCGYIPKKELLKLISTFGVGLCIYSDNTAFNLYRDSVKVREAIAVGTPVISTNNHDNSSEVKRYKLGEVVNSKSENLSDEIKSAYLKILNDYVEYEKNCLDYYRKTYKSEEIINFLLIMSNAN